MKRRSRNHTRPASRRATTKGLTALFALAVVFGVVSTSAQAAPVLLGTNDSFAVLGGSAVTNTGPSTISGNVGVSPDASVTGFPPGIVTGGTIHAADGVASQAQSDLVIAYDDAAGRVSTATISADPTGSTLAPGVYTSASSIGISGDLTLDAQGDPDAVFVFQAGSELLAGSSSRILLQGGAQACNVYWQVGSSATIGTGSAFAGNILALTSIAMQTGATLEGRALARNGAVTLDTNVITKADCQPSTTGPDTTAGPGITGTDTTTTGTPRQSKKQQAKAKRQQAKQVQKQKKKNRRKKNRVPPAFTG